LFATLKGVRESVSRINGINKCEKGERKRKRERERERERKKQR
jgi:hypothetical protein